MPDNLHLFSVKRIDKTCKITFCYQHFLCVGFKRTIIQLLARDLVVPPNRISGIVNGKRAITADTALRLQRYFKIEAQFWLNLQSEHDLRIIKRKIWSDIERRILPVQDIQEIKAHEAMA